MAKDWGCVLQGADFDLEDWADCLKKPFDPWIHRNGSQFALRSKTFDDALDAQEVRDRSVALIDQLNGAMAALKGSSPVSFGGVVEYAQDGKEHATIFIDAMIETRSRVKAIASTPGGQAQAPTPVECPAQEWVRIAEQDGHLEDALDYFGRASLPVKRNDPTHWFDIYKTIESLEHKYGGEKGLQSKGWVAADDLKALKTTANFSRHARRKFAPPKTPVSVQTARSLLATIVKGAFAEEKTP